MSAVYKLAQSKFQSTHPLRGATFRRLLVIQQIQISIHAPLAGCDLFLVSGAAHLSIFQSTHPLRGATRGGAKAGGSHTDFNPRTPCGVRPAATISQYTFLGFQSTHPLRGATLSRVLPGCLEQNFNPRTPCGVRLGSDSGSGNITDFNPRTPCGVRRRRTIRLSRRCLFQSTHPLRGATDLFLDHRHPLRISIHAPLAGCDPKGAVLQSTFV